VSQSLRPANTLQRVYLYRDAIDFRKSYRSLSAIIELELGHNPFDGELYVFINRQRNKIKCLFWERNGFVLYYKALAEEKFKHC
jgi:transposase